MPRIPLGEHVEPPKDNPWERQARLAKAIVVAEFLESNGVSVAAAGDLWAVEFYKLELVNQLKAKTGMKKGPSDQTWTLALHLLHEREVVRNQNGVSGDG